MKNCKKVFSLILSLAMLVCLFAGCGGNEETTPTKVMGGTVVTNDVGETTVVGGVSVEDIKGITDTTIYVGNTAAVTGAYQAIGEPFNVGIRAAFAKYNAAGGYDGLLVELINYDDTGDAAQSVTLMNQLIYDDEVFAIVGNFGSYAVASNLDIIIDANVPMVYAAAGNDILFNDAAEGNEKAVFPVQPLCYTEGRMLILRAFAPVDKGGMGGTKVGVLTNNDESSQTMLAGIKDEAAGLTGEIIYQNVASGDYSAAVAAFKDAGCDVIVYASSLDFTTALLAMANAEYYATVLTSYNNSNAAIFNENNLLKSEYEPVLANIPIFAQAWLDITSTEYFYNNTEHGLYAAYAAFGMAVEGTGVAGFSEEYWGVAEAIFDYCKSVDRADAWAMSYNSYALAGYIAGDLFCQGLAALEASGQPLTRANFISIMESQEYNVALANAISFANGLRAGVDSFALTYFYDAYAYNGGAYHAAASVTSYGLTSIEEYRAILGG